MEMLTVGVRKEFVGRKKETRGRTGRGKDQNKNTLVGSEKRIPPRIGRAAPIVSHKWRANKLFSGPRMFG